ncbi:MAG TPA: protein kinase [Polyangiaceae bacterium]|nr:protein kinase [Polyangiaceae bacterium]
MRAKNRVHTLPRQDPLAKVNPPKAGSSLPPSGQMLSFRAGEVVADRYELIRCIGTGAMGAVFRAHDRVLDAELAIKLIRIDRERIDADRATKRLLLEARAIARISHPGIVRVFDFGSSGEVPFIVMELLQGESLLELMSREGAMDAVRAVRALLPIADALSVAHRRGVVHRDIKPDNVFLHRDEFARVQPKLVDFGVARVQQGSGFTRPGALMGTPDYMAPEQAQAEPDVDHRADIWAFGVLLYELMTLRRPFAEGAHGNYLAVLKAVVGSPPRPILDYGVGDAALWAILSRALEKARHQRFQDIREMGEQLSRWLLARGVTEDAYGGSLISNWSVVGEPLSPVPELTSMTMRRGSTGELELQSASDPSWPPGMRPTPVVPQAIPQQARPSRPVTGQSAAPGSMLKAASARPTAISERVAHAVASLKPPASIKSESVKSEPAPERARTRSESARSENVRPSSARPERAVASSAPSATSTVTDPPTGGRLAGKLRLRPTPSEWMAVVIAILLASLLAVVSVWFGALGAEPEPQPHSDTVGAAR